MNHDISNVGKLHTFPPGKSIEKYREKINNDITNCEKVFDKSADLK